VNSLRIQQASRSAGAHPVASYSPPAPLDLLRSRLSDKYDLAVEELLIAGSTFSLVKVRDTNRLVDAIDPETFADDERLPYWAELWSSSLELARWCLEEPGMGGMRVLELGCGLGLAGIAAAKAGAVVTLSDYEQDALDFARCNAMMNLAEEICTTHVSFMHLDWRAVPPLEPFDLIIAADIVYERRSFFPLVDLLRQLLRHRGRAVFTEPCRSIGERFFGLLTEEGFHLTATESTHHLNGKEGMVRRVLIRQ
jgi:predicted nicotinamide N-methyase